MAISVNNDIDMATVWMQAALASTASPDTAHVVSLRRGNKEQEADRRCRRSGGAISTRYCAVVVEVIYSGAVIIIIIFIIRFPRVMLS